jgi:hypothetical protein
MKTFAFLAAILLSCSAWSTTFYQVNEPQPSKRVITLKLMHPRAATNPVRSIRVEALNVGQVTKLLSKHRGIYEDAIIDCQGGYNPLSKTEGVDYLQLKIASTQQGLVEPFASSVATTSMHDLCMTKALDFAAQLTRQSALKQ